MGSFDKRTTFLISRDQEDLWYGSDCIARRKITDLLLAEHALRELTQREETLYRRVIALQKATAIESDRAQLNKANEQLEETQAQYPRKEYALYRAESMLASKFKEAYDSLRRDARWFMREEMVQDCSDRGGCCSRECGCCAQRHLSKRKKGQGHCTTECGCCIGFRGFELPEEEKEEIRKDLESRLETRGSAYLKKLANWFFCPFKPQTLSQPKSRWQKFFRWGATDERES